MKILLLGVVCGPSGIAALKGRLPAARAAGGFDLVFACADFARGRTPYDEAALTALFAAGVDLLLPSVNACSDRLAAAFHRFAGRIVPPANHPMFRDDPRTVPLVGPKDAPLPVVSLGGVEGLFSVTGSETVNPLDSPYDAFSRALERCAGIPPAVIFFSHSTAEKEAFATFADGRCRLFAGHGGLVKSDDEMAMEAGTAYVTDLGVVGTRLVEAPAAERPATSPYRTIRPAKPPLLSGAPPLRGSLFALTPPAAPGRGQVLAPWRECAPAADPERETLRDLYEVSRLVSQTIELDELLSAVMSVATRLLHCEASSILLLDEKTQQLSFKLAQGTRGEAAKRLIHLKVGQGIAGHCAATRAPVIVPDCAKDPRFYRDGDRLTEFETRSLIAVPLLFREKLVGVLEVLNRRGENPFDERDVEFLQLVGRQVAGPIVNARLYDNTLQFYRSTLKVLAHALDAKDTYTHGHSQRVALYSVAIAQELGFSEGARADLEFAALLHDIGKIGIRDTILCKPGRLTPEEFAIIKMHPVLSAHILDPVEFLADKIPIVRHHHERWDGMGYPDGLIGEAIPLGARIICVADTFDAMTSDRAYRKGQSARVALDEIRRCAGSQFDPAIAAAFLHVFERDFASMFDDMQAAFARQEPVADVTIDARLS